MRYIPFKQQFRDCAKLGVAEMIIEENDKNFNHFKCNKYGGKCVSSTCYEERTGADRDSIASSYLNDI
jgi:hypothetical protein